MRTTLSHKARAGLLTGALAVIAAGAVSIAPADAQAARVLTVSPSTITVGQSADLIATGCVADADQADLYVVFGSDEGGPGGTDPQPTDAEGTATFNTGPAPEGAEGTYVITAQCVFDNGEGFDVLFSYDPAELTVVGATPTTSEAPTTTAVEVADVVAVAPAFTG